MKIVIVHGKKLEFLGIHHVPLGEDEIRIAVGPGTKVGSVARILKKLSTHEDWFGVLDLPDGFMDAKTLSGNPPKGVKVRR